MAVAWNLHQTVSRHCRCVHHWRRRLHNRSRHRCQRCHACHRRVLILCSCACLSVTWATQIRFTLNGEFVGGAPVPSSSSGVAADVTAADHEVPHMYPCIQFSPDVQLAVDVSATDVSQVEAGSDGGAGSLQPSPLLASVLTKTGSSGASAAAATAAVVETPSGGPSSLRASSSLRLCSVGRGCACAVPYVVPSIGRHAQRHLGWRRRQVPLASHGVAAGLSTLLACPPCVPRAHRRVRTIVAVTWQCRVPHAVLTPCVVSESPPRPARWCVSVHP